MQRLWPEVLYHYDHSSSLLLLSYSHPISRNLIFVALENTVAEDMPVEMSIMHSVESEEVNIDCMCNVYVSIRIFIRI